MSKESTEERPKHEHGREKRKSDAQIEACLECSNVHRETVAKLFRLAELIEHSPRLLKALDEELQRSGQRR